MCDNSTTIGFQKIMCIILELSISTWNIISFETMFWTDILKFPLFALIFDLLIFSQNPFLSKDFLSLQKSLNIIEDPLNC